MRLRIATIAGLMFLLAVGADLSSRQAAGFGLERWSKGTRYHYEISKGAAAASGFGGSAAHLVAWVNDALDVYLNHPLWDVNNFMKGHGHWEDAHFDNLFTPAAIANQWQRYVYGTFYGLLWAAQNNDRMAAFTILGTACHAFEDFFSHSTWLNDHARHRITPFDTTEEWLRRLPSNGRDPRSLWTGAYARTAPSDKQPHGGEGIGNKFRAAFAKAQCARDGGINLDRTCSAKLGASNRRMTRKTGWRQLFDTARQLAGKADRQLFALMSDALRRVGKGGFWGSLQRYRPPSTPRTGSKWKPSHFHKSNKSGLRNVPWAFLTGGKYGAGAGWYIRVQIKVTDGTDGDLFVRCGSSREHFIGRSWYNDFERGDNDAYFFGPFGNFSTLRLRLKNKGFNPDLKGRVVVHAFRVGGRPAYGKIVDSNVSLDNSSKTWRVGLPRAMNFALAAFGASRGPAAAPGQPLPPKTKPPEARARLSLSPRRVTVRAGSHRFGIKASVSGAPARVKVGTVPRGLSVYVYKVVSRGKKFLRTRANRSYFMTGDARGFPVAAGGVLYIKVGAARSMRPGRHQVSIQGSGLRAALEITVK